MARRLVFNPLAGLDMIEDDVAQVVAPSNVANPDMEVIADGSTDGVVYFWVNGHRFKLTGTMDDPVITGGGEPIGLLLALTKA